MWVNNMIVYTDKNNNKFNLLKAKDYDLSWVYRCLKDFPYNIWESKRKVRDWIDMCDEIDDDALEQDPIPPFMHYMLILERQSDSEKLGLVIFDHNISHTDNTYTGVYIHYAAIHPDYRGNGYYTVLHDAMTWLCNQYMQADEGYYKILEQAPQVKSKAESNGGKLEKSVRRNNGKDIEEDVVLLRLQDVDSALSKSQKNSGKLFNSSGSEVKTKREKLNKNKP